MQDHGMSERQAREFLQRELSRNAASTSFYWESEEIEEALELVVDAVAKAIAANNKQLLADLEQAARMARLQAGM